MRLDWDMGSGAELLQRCRPGAMFPFHEITYHYAASEDDDFDNFVHGYMVGLRASTMNGQQMMVTWEFVRQLLIRGNHRGFLESFDEDVRDDVLGEGSEA